MQITQISIAPLVFAYSVGTLETLLGNSFTGKDTSGRVGIFLGPDANGNPVSSFNSVNLLTVWDEPLTGGTNSTNAAVTISAADINNWLTQLSPSHDDTYKWFKVTTTDKGDFYIHLDNGMPMIVKYRVRISYVENGISKFAWMPGTGSYLALLNAKNVLRVYDADEEKYVDTYPSYGYGDDSGLVRLSNGTIESGGVIEVPETSRNIAVIAPVNIMSPCIVNNEFDVSFSLSGQHTPPAPATLADNYALDHRAVIDEALLLLDIDATYQNFAYHPLNCSPAMYMAPLHLPNLSSELLVHLVDKTSYESTTIHTGVTLKIEKDVAVTASIAPLFVGPQSLLQVDVGFDNGTSSSEGDLLLFRPTEAGHHDGNDWVEDAVLDDVVLRTFVAAEESMDVSCDLCALYRESAELAPGTDVYLKGTVVYDEGGSDLDVSDELVVFGLGSAALLSDQSAALDYSTGDNVLTYYLDGVSSVLNGDLQHSAISSQLTVDSATFTLMEDGSSVNNYHFNDIATPVAYSMLNGVFAAEEIVFDAALPTDGTYKVALALLDSLYQPFVITAPESTYAGIVGDITSTVRALEVELDGSFTFDIS